MCIILAHWLVAAAPACLTVVFFPQLFVIDVNYAVSSCVYLIVTVYPLYCVFFAIPLFSFQLFAILVAICMYSCLITHGWSRLSGGCGPECVDLYCHFQSLVFVPIVTLSEARSDVSHQCCVSFPRAGRQKENVSLDNGTDRIRGKITWIVIWL